MKKLLFVSLLSLPMLMANAQVKMPAPSPGQTIKQEFALGNIEVVYSRPVAKGRKIVGDLIPMNKLWRMGANASTKIKFSDPVEIGGKKVDSGTYVLYSIPAQNEWTFILNKGLSNWGIDGYKETEDVVRFNVPVTNTSDHTESFTMQFTDVKPETANLEVAWEKTKLVIPIKADIRDRMRTSIENEIKNGKKPYQQAAQYYMDFEQDYNNALKYITLATQENPNAFWLLLNKARLEKQLGKKAEALKSAQTSLELAKKAKNNDYIKMNEELIGTLK